MNIIEKTQRISSVELKQQLPLSPETQESISQHQQELSDIIQGKVNKKIVIMGPCSADFRRFNNGLRT